MGHASVVKVGIKVRAETMCSVIRTACPADYLLLLGLRVYIIITICTSTVRYRSFSSLTSTRVEFNTGREELLYKFYNIIYNVDSRDDR